MNVSCISSAAAREVVVVDDDVDGREILAALLERSGYTVFPAANGREALDHLRNSSPPAVIILDLMMPVMDGWEFLEQQARDPALVDIPVIVLTGTPPRHSLRAKAILRKPIQLESLLEMVERFLPTAA